MSDLSQPLTFTLQPAASPAAPPATAGPSARLSGSAPPPPDPFAWPTPPLPAYPAPSASSSPEVCEIEGLNGRTMVGRLVLFSPADGLLQLRHRALGTPTTLRFDQFRRLRLQQTLAAVQALPGQPEAGLLSERPGLPFAVHFKSGAPWLGTTVGWREEAYGLFLFEPVNADAAAEGDGAVRRSFVPRAAYAHAELGPRIGQALVEQQAATAEQVDAALAEQQQMRSRKLGDILLLRQIVTAAELASAIEQQAKMPMVRIGEALCALGFITEVQLGEALAEQRADRNVPLGELLVRKNMVSRADLQTALARKMGYPLVDVLQFPADTDAVARLPYAVATRLPALPLVIHAGRLVVAVEDPSHRSAIDEIEFAAQLKVVPVLARAGVLGGAIEKAYEKIGAAVGSLRWQPEHNAPALDFEPGDAGRLLATLELQHHKGDNRAGGDDDDAAIEQSDNSLVRLINSMIMEAHAQGVSDIHVECPPGREKVRIRFRKDGQLRPYMELPHTYRSALVARIKIMCDLDISERRKPQDGKINFAKFVQNTRLELRVATIPTHGNHEDAVLRLLTSAKPIPLENLNLSPPNLATFQALVQRPYGLLLCVGPTGSGKTTTLHSALGFINTPERKIWTAEDPIEITQAGLRQVQVNPKIEWTFAKALRSFLRADPDVIMLGEIRDHETAQVSIEASLTGHLVLSTLHTNSAPETVTRLLDMGMDPFNFADALLGVLAQRLVRRLCVQCRVAHDATPEEEEELLRDWLHPLAAMTATPRPEGADVLTEWRRRFGGAVQGGHEGQAGTQRLALYRPVGCDACDRTGFKGRAGIHEMMRVSRGLRHLIQTGTPAAELQRHALGDGMRTLRQDGIEKVLAGVTTIEEVRANS